MHRDKWLTQHLPFGICHLKFGHLEFGAWNFDLGILRNRAIWADKGKMVVQEGGRRLLYTCNAFINMEIARRSLKKCLTKVLIVSIFAPHLLNPESFNSGMHRGQRSTRSN
jgi:hypothetical protein